MAGRAAAEMSSPETTEIVSGPIPDEYRNACFVVRIGNRHVDAFGSGLRQADFDVSAQVMSAISEFRQRAPRPVLLCLPANSWLSLKRLARFRRLLVRDD